MRSAGPWDCARRRAVGAGLGFVNRRGRLQDSFRARILFPICDPRATRWRSGAGSCPGGTDPAKYKNSTETPIYSKRRTLYALNWAKQEIIKTDEVVVCEGYTDVIGLFGAGVRCAVATCGTALAEDHVKLLRDFASRVVLAFDADGAGQSAAGRFYEWERRLEIDVAVAALPAGSDPGELARTDPEGAASRHRGAKPFLQFRVERILDAAELATPEGRAKAADTALAAVAEHPDNLVRDQYLMQVAERCRLEPLPLRDRLEQLRRRDPGPAPAAGAGRATVGPDRQPAGRPRLAGEPWVREPDDDGWDADGVDGGRTCGRRRSRSGGATGPGPGRPVREFRPGLEALRLAIHRPEDVGDRLEAALFRDDLQRAAFEVLAERTTISTRPSTAPRPRSGPCWCA